MIIDFDDDCFAESDAGWIRQLIALLVDVSRQEQHAVLATPARLLDWCREHLRVYESYFQTRLSQAQPRASAVEVRVSVAGAAAVGGAPPWTLSAGAAASVLARPLRLVLENNESDLRFIRAAMPRLGSWLNQGWVVPAMGGGSAMVADIASTSTDAVARWRTFYMFDSDRLHPDELAGGWTPPKLDGCQGYEFEAACANMPVSRWHRLKRRSIENYLPKTVLDPVNGGAAGALFSSSVGGMAHFYNMKKGLAGDGVSPQDPNKAVRAGRSKGFWSALPPAEAQALERGFGPSVSDQFAHVQATHPWPADVVAEISALADALQDAM